MTKKALAVSLVLVGAVAAFVFSSVRKEKALEQETTAFVVDTVSAISDGWNAQALVSRAEPGLIQAMEGQGRNIDDLFHVYRKLGRS